jgi:hypothetical protein
MRADELTFKANKKVGANNDIVNAISSTISLSKFLL